MITALIERGADGTYSVFTSDINSTIIGEGSTVHEAIEDFENSYHEVVRFYLEDGKQLPEELLNAEFEYQYDDSFDEMKIAI